MAKRRNFKDQFKAKVALEELRGDKTVQEIAAKHQSQLPPRVSLNMDDIHACLVLSRNLRVDLLCAGRFRLNL